MLHSVHLWCVGSTDSHISVSHLVFCCTSPERHILMMCLSVTWWSCFHFWRSPKVHILLHMHTFWFLAFETSSGQTSYQPDLYFCVESTQSLQSRRYDQSHALCFLLLFSSMLCWDIFQGNGELLRSDCSHREEVKFEKLQSLRINRVLGGKLM